EYQHGWGGRSYYTQMRLQPLPPSSAGGGPPGLLRAHPPPRAVQRALIERPRGQPLFPQERARTPARSHGRTGERGAYRLERAPATIQVPATVQAVLASRIDRLPPEDKRLLHAASVIGKDVPLALLRSLAEAPEDVLRDILGRLQAGEFLFQR